MKNTIKVIFIFFYLLGPSQSLLFDYKNPTIVDFDGPECPLYSIGASGVTFGSIVFRCRFGLSDFQNQGTLSHELVHVRQFEDRGVPLFFVEYVALFFLNCDPLIILNLKHCHENPMELEAYDKEQSKSQNQEF